MNTGVEGGETACKIARAWAYMKKQVPDNQAKVRIRNTQLILKSTYNMYYFFRFFLPKITSGDALYLLFLHQQIH